jgi:uncharacterized repeat protein (TIGR01451 family)
MLTVLAAAGVLLLGADKSARAATVDGTLVTNIASATFGSVSAVSYEVSYCSTATVWVISPCVAMWKWIDDGAVWREWPAVGSGNWIPMQSSGCTVTYKLEINNCSEWTSAFNVTLTDKLPDNTSLVIHNLDDFNGNTPYQWIYSWSPNNVAPWTNGAMPAGQASPAYLRWVLRNFGMTWRSAYVRYAVRVL